MGLVAIGICVAAAINLHGTLRIAAIVVALVNFGTLRRMAWEDGPAAPLWNFLTTIAGVGLLTYSFVT